MCATPKEGHGKLVVVGLIAGLDRAG